MGLTVGCFHVFAGDLVDYTQSIRHLSLKLLPPVSVLSRFQLFLALKNRFFKLIKVIEDKLPVGRAVFVLEIGGLTDEERVRIAVLIL